MHFRIGEKPTEKAHKSLILQAKTAEMAVFCVVEVRGIERITGYLWSL